MVVCGCAEWRVFEGAVVMAARWCFGLWVGSCSQPPFSIAGPFMVPYKYMPQAGFDPPLIRQTR